MNFSRKQIATQLKAVLHETYKNNHDTSGAYKFTMEEVGKRQLKNRCFAYLMLLPNYVETGMKQFNDSLKSNMTDTIAALAGLANIESAFAPKKPGSVLYDMET